MIEGNAENIDEEAKQVEIVKESKKEYRAMKRQYLNIRQVVLMF